MAKTSDATCGTCADVAPDDELQAEELAVLCKALAHPARVQLLQYGVSSFSVQ